MIKIKVIIMNNKITSFMQACDMFEKSKVIKSGLLTIEYKKNFTKKNLLLLKEGMERMGHSVIAVFNNKKIFYKNNDIKMISDGHQAVFLEEYIHYIMHK